MGLNLLIVEDNLDVLAMHEYAIKKGAYGDIGLHEIRLQADLVSPNDLIWADTVLLDLHLPPGPSGIHVIRLAEPIEHPPRIVVLSAYCTMLTESDRARVDTVLTKPSPIEDIRRAIHGP